MAGLPQPLTRHSREQLADDALDPGSDLLGSDRRRDRRGLDCADTAQFDRG
ncbi:hypothetical protein [Streptomyces broussonetiae]|uniref:hypothetical protein n=1 Tax=Streptomyces broussonetiae TaxID=2686304 RepID=UPI0035DC34E3